MLGNSTLGSNTLGNTFMGESAFMVEVSVLGLSSLVFDVGNEYDYTVFPDSEVIETNTVQIYDFELDYTVYEDSLIIESSIQDVSFQGIIFKTYLGTMESISEMIDPAVGFFFTVFMDSMSIETNNPAVQVGYDYTVDVASLSLESNTYPLDFEISASAILDVISISSDALGPDVNYDYTVIIEEVGELVTSTEDEIEVEAEWNVFPWKPNSNVKNIKPRSK